jgi:predicted 3-demethylubiquinone-9 3-methyltransferase (glyoxalase superfamily)
MQRDTDKIRKRMKQDTTKYSQTNWSYSTQIETNIPEKCRNYWNTLLRNTAETRPPGWRIGSAHIVWLSMSCAFDQVNNRSLGCTQAPLR